MCCFQHLVCDNVFQQPETSNLDGETAGREINEEATTIYTKETSS